MGLRIARGINSRDPSNDSHETSNERRGWKAVCELQVGEVVWTAPQGVWQALLMMGMRGDIVPSGTEEAKDWLLPHVVLAVRHIAHYAESPEEETAHDETVEEAHQREYSHTYSKLSSEAGRAPNGDERRTEEGRTRRYGEFTRRLGGDIVVDLMPRFGVPKGRKLVDYIEEIFPNVKSGHSIWSDVICSDKQKQTKNVTIDLVHQGPGGANTSKAPAPAPPSQSRLRISDTSAPMQIRLHERSGKPSFDSEGVYFTPTLQSILIKNDVASTEKVMIEVDQESKKPIWYDIASEIRKDILLRARRLKEQRETSDFKRYLRETGRRDEEVREQWSAEGDQTGYRRQLQCWEARKASERAARKKNDEESVGTWSSGFESFLADSGALFRSTAGTVSTASSQVHTSASGS